jgi:bifunctional ADP-heptose synthase (sugar kinase/adenylyltransferase)
VDTRTKLLASEQASEVARQCRAAGRTVTLVTGFFDPLLAAHARRLEELARPGGTLFVAVRDPEHPLLPARARAELVAALRVVDYVILGGAIAADAFFQEEAADERLTRELIQHVHDRQK